MAEQPKSNGEVGADLSNTPNFDNAGKDVAKEVDYSSAGTSETKPNDWRKTINSILDSKFEEIKKEVNKEEKHTVALIDVWYRSLHEKSLAVVFGAIRKSFIEQQIKDSLTVPIKNTEESEKKLEEAQKRVKEWNNNPANAELQKEVHSDDYLDDENTDKRARRRHTLESIVEDYILSNLFDENGEPSPEVRSYVKNSAQFYSSFEYDGRDFLFKKGISDQLLSNEKEERIEQLVGAFSDDSFREKGIKIGGRFKEKQRHKGALRHLPEDKRRKIIDLFAQELESAFTQPSQAETEIGAEPPQSAGNAQPSQTESEIGADLANIPTAPEAGADVSSVPEPSQPAESAQPPMPSESQASAQEPVDAIGQEIDDQVKSFLDSIYGEAVKYATVKKTRKDSFDSFISDLPFYLATAMGEKRIGEKDQKVRTKRAQKYILSRYFDEHGEPTKELKKLIEEVQPIWPNNDVEYDVETFRDQIPSWFGTDAKDKAIRLFREYATAQRENGTAPSAPSTPSPNANPSPSQNPAEENPGSPTRIPDFIDFAYHKDSLGYEPFDATKMKKEPEYGEGSATAEHEDNRKRTQAFAESFLEANPFASNRRIRQEARKHGVDITATKWLDAVRERIFLATGFAPTPAQQQIGDALYSLLDNLNADDETRSQYILDLETQGAIFDRQPTKAGFFDRHIKSSEYNKRKEAVEQELVQKEARQKTVLGEMQTAATNGDKEEVERLQKELKELQKEIANLNATFQRLRLGFKDFDTPKEKADDYAGKAKELMEELKSGIDSMTGQWKGEKPMSPELEAYVRTDDEGKRRRILGGTKGRDRQNEDELIAQYIVGEEQKKERQKFQKKAEKEYRRYRYAQRGEKIGGAIGRPLAWLGDTLQRRGSYLEGEFSDDLSRKAQEERMLGASTGRRTRGKVKGWINDSLAYGSRSLGSVQSGIGKFFSASKGVLGKVGGAMGTAAGALAGPVGAVITAITAVVTAIKWGVKQIDASVQKAFQSAPFNGRIAAAKMQYEGEEFSRKQRFAAGTEESSVELIEAWSKLREETLEMRIAWRNLINTLLEIGTKLLGALATFDESFGHVTKTVQAVVKGLDYLWGALERFAKWLDSDEQGEEGEQGKENKQGEEGKQGGEDEQGKEGKKKNRWFKKTLKSAKDAAMRAAAVMVNPLGAVHDSVEAAIEYAKQPSQGELAELGVQNGILMNHVIASGNLARKFYETGEIDDELYQKSTYAFDGLTKDDLVKYLNDESNRDEIEDVIAFRDKLAGGEYWQGYKSLEGGAPATDETINDVLKTLQNIYVQNLKDYEELVKTANATEETAENTREKLDKNHAITEGPLWDALMRSANKYNPTGAGTEAVNGAEWGEPSRQYGRFAAEGARQQNWGRR